MTSRERILAALRREDVDRVPCCVAFNPLTPVQRQGHTWNFPWAPDAPGEEKLAYQVEQLGLDQVVGVYVDLCRPAPGVQARVRREGDLLHKEYETPAGTLRATVRVNELWPHGEEIHFYSDHNIGHFVKPWIETEQDLACMKAILRLDESRAVLDETRAAVARSKQLAARFGLATMAHVGRGLTGAMPMFGASELCLLTIENPDFLHAYLEHEHRINLRTIEILGECGIDILRRNGFYETADFYGPATLEQFLGDRLRGEAGAARACGMLTSYTVHTGVMPILDYLVGLPFDSLFGIDTVFKDVDPCVVHAKLGSTKSFWTGPSSTYHLWRGPEATRLAVRRVFEVFTRTGLILCPCVSSHAIMPWESTLAMIDEWRKLR